MNQNYSLISLMNETLHSFKRRTLNEINQISELFSLVKTNAQYRRETFSRRQITKCKVCSYFSSLRFQWIFSLRSTQAVSQFTTQLSNTQTYTFKQKLNNETNQKSEIHTKIHMHTHKHKTTNQYTKRELIAWMIILSSFFLDKNNVCCCQWNFACSVSFCLLYANLSRVKPLYSLMRKSWLFCFTSIVFFMFCSFVFPISFLWKIS